VTAASSGGRVLAVDFGLSGVRAAVVDETGHPHGFSRAASPTKVGQSDSARADALVEAVIDTAATALARADSHVDAICVVGLGPVPVLVDKAGNALASGWLGRTARPQGDEQATQPRDHALPYLRDLEEREPEILGRTDVVVDLVGYVVLRLTGRQVMDRITAYYYTSESGLPVASPAVTEPDSVGGHLTPSAAARLGTTPGVPVLTGTIDCFADLRGGGVKSLGDAGLILGSTLVIGVVAEQSAAPPGLDATPHLGEGVWVGGATSSAGLSIDWIADLLGVDDGTIQRAGELDPGETIALPYLAGERTPFHDPLARGLIAGITLTTGPEHLYRAMVDGVAVTALDHLDHLKRAGLAPPRFRVLGGGVKNRLLLTEVCNAIGLPLDVVDIGTPAAGAASLALSTIGFELQAPILETVNPDNASHLAYRNLLEVSRQLWRDAGTHIRARINQPYDPDAPHSRTSVDE